MRPTTTTPAVISTITPTTAPPSMTTATTLYTTTSGGQVVIVTSVITAIISGPLSDSSSSTTSPLVLNGNSSGSANFFANTGAVAGTFVVVALVIIGLLVTLFLLYRRRKRAQQLDRDTRQAYGGAGDGGAGVSKFGNDEEEDTNPFERAAMSDASHGAYNSRPMSQGLGGGVLPSGAYGNRMSSGGMSSGGISSNQYRLSQESSHSGSGGSGNGLMGAGYLPSVSLGATLMAGYGAQYGGPGSQEGVVGGYSEWPEYVSQSANGSGEGSPAEGVPSGSAEETAGSTSLSNSQHSSQRRAIVRDSVDSIYPGDYSAVGARKSLPPPPPAHLDDRLDPQTIRLAQHSEGDEHDFTRRILRVANPEDDD